MSQSGAPVSTTAKVANNSMWYGLETALSILSAIASSVLVARAFGPERLAPFNYILWLTNVTGAIGMVGISSATRKFMADHFAVKDEQGAMVIFRTVMRWQAAWMGLLALVGLAAVLQWAQPGFRFVAALLVVSSWMRVMAFIPSAANMAAENMAANVPGSVAGGLLQVAGTLATVAGGWGLEGIAMAQLVGYTVELIWKLWPLARRARAARGQSLPPALRRRILTFATEGAGLILLHMVVWDRSDILMLNWLHPDPAQVSFYFLAFNLVERILLLPQTFSQAMGASAMAEYGRDARRAVSLTVTAGIYLMLISLPLLFGAAAVSGPVWMLYGPKFQPATQVFVAMCLLAVPRAMMSPAQTLLQAAERQRNLVWSGCAAAAVKFGLGWILIPRYGALGAALANGTAQAVAGIAAWLFVWWLFTPSPIPFWPALKILASGSLMALCAAAVAGALPPWLGAPAAIAAGVLVFAILLRFTGALGGTDRDRLLALEKLAPARLRYPYRRFIGTMIPG